MMNANTDSAGVTVLICVKVAAGKSTIAFVIVLYTSVNTVKKADYISVFLQNYF